MQEMVKRILTHTTPRLPSRMHGDALACSRARNVKTVAAVSLLTVPFFALFYALKGDMIAALGTLSSLVVMALAPVAMEWTRSPRVGQHLFILALYAEMVFMSARLGGLAAPSAPWLLCCPVTAVFLGGTKDVTAWLLIVVATYIGFLVWGTGGWPYPANSPLAHDTHMQALCSIGLVLVVVLVTLDFDRAKSASMAKLEQALERIQELSVRDELTGVYNRRHLMDLLQHAHATGSGRFCIAIVDIDHFKRINDNHGHGAGDAVLKRMADTVQAHVRPADTFGRYGGEEFVLFLAATGLDGAPAVCDRVSAVIRALDLADIAPQLRLTVSIGVAEHSRGETIVDTLNRADSGLYHAKAQGRDKVVAVDAAGAMFIYAPPASQSP